MTEHARVAADPAQCEHLARLVAHSRAVITSNQHPDGAYPAAPTFSAYQGYAWLRDGSFTAEAMSRTGDVASVDAFHDWVARVLLRRSAQVAEIAAAAARGEHLPVDRLLPTRFTLLGADGTDEWWDFQIDGYGTWLWAATTHAARHGVDLTRWGAPMTVAVNYLCAVWDRPCYDWWEEHVDQRHPSALGAVFAGLTSAVGSGALDPSTAARATDVAEAARRLCLGQGTTAGRAGDPTAAHLAKWLGSDQVDASLAACVVPFGLLAVGSPLATATLDAVSRDLDVSGGVHRFRADVFYGGGQWLLLSCLLGWNRAAAGDHEAALKHLLWVAAHALPDGDMPEQVPDLLLHPEHRAEWLQRWGPVATPLLWSHAMFLILADELGLLPEAVS